MSRIVGKKSTILILLALLVVGCDSYEDAGLTRYIKKIKSRPAKPIEPIPKFEPLSKFKYPENANRRNPFKPVAIEKQATIAAPDTTRPKQPLEAFPLDSLAFVGVLQQGRNNWALIRQPGDIISRVKAGDYMGKNFGQVISVSDDAIVVEETVQVGGNWEKKKAVIKLQTANN